MNLATAHEKLKNSQFIANVFMRNIKPCKLYIHSLRSTIEATEKLKQ